ncbi:hypothetical protein FGKAn22_05540 [Ferrigenium kumadai]|uniref:Uncharacterized protein n=1 Tax=Ferrigenium kumadai TaxID=1682490 RepID=A0AAN1SYE7_9PROT|nr:hypothetical protein [Ferrigenium kumadai]BBI98861.1 hypothetical protein FGKAn22_05540 [Ferrigenium kumadai]
MIELVLLAVVVATVILAIRKGGAAVPVEPLIVQRPGQYHITLAPQLDSSLGFIEAVAQRLAGDSQPAGDTPTIFFQVRRAGGQAENFYLLAIAFRKGVFFIQAIVPRPLRDSESHLAALREFSDAVLLNYPPVPPFDAAGAERIDASVEEVAQQSGIVVSKLVA